MTIASKHWEAWLRPVGPGPTPPERVAWCNPLDGTGFGVGGVDHWIGALLLTT